MPAMISSAAFPKVAFNSPPSPSPTRAASASVARPIQPATGTMAMAEQMNRAVGFDEPGHIRIATDARPETVQKMFSRTYAVGAHFGVIVVLEDGFQFEVATFRSDGAYLDGRHPTEVHFATAAEDAARRDFTINGMFFDPEANEFVDFVGGRADLERRLVRAIGDPAQRFAEDRLRMLRAIRFATVLG